MKVDENRIHFHFERKEPEFVIESSKRENTCEYPTYPYMKTGYLLKALSHCDILIYPSRVRLSKNKFRENEWEKYIEIKVDLFKNRFTGHLAGNWARVWVSFEMQFYILSVEMYFGKRCLVGGGINQMYWFVSLKIILAKPKTRKEKTHSLHSVASPITQPRFSVKNRPFLTLNRIVFLNIYSDVSLVTDRQISRSP